VGPRAGLDDVKKRKFLTLPILKLRPLGRLAHNQSLYTEASDVSTQQDAEIYYIYSANYINILK
jgi:hypothetical protein